MVKKPAPKASKSAKSPKKAKEPLPGSLPASIINALPTSGQVMKHLAAIGPLIPQLEIELGRAKKGGAVSLARAFVALHRMSQRVDEILKPLFGKEQLFERYKTVELPALFQHDGVTSVPLAEGFRVGVSARYFASIKPDMKDKAYDWLRANGLGDIIAETVNSQTLSASLKKELEEKNQEPPSDIFNVALVPTTSVTKT